MRCTGCGDKMDMEKPAPGKTVEKDCPKCGTTNKMVGKKGS